jgi:hypothetical protein
MKELLTLLTILRDKAPSISFTKPDHKTTSAGLLACLASDVGESHISFQLGKCHYKVVNTWEHFDLLIRNHKRINGKNYGTNSSNSPKLRTRRAAEQGFTVTKSPASKLKLGDVFYGSEHQSQLHICIAVHPADGITVQSIDPHYHPDKQSKCTAKNVSSATVHIPKCPEWFLIQPHSQLNLKAKKALIKHNPELFKRYLTLKSQQTASTPKKSALPAITATPKKQKAIA